MAKQEQGISVASGIYIFSPFNVSEVLSRVIKKAREDSEIAGKQPPKQDAGKKQV